MKQCKSLFVYVIVPALLLLSFQLRAQILPDHTPEHGFWQIVSNIHARKDAVIQCYNDDRLLIYEERVRGRRLSVKDPRILRYLNQVLEKALAAYAINKELLTDKDWLAFLLHK